MLTPEKFALLRHARRVWAIGAIHGQYERLNALHEALWARLEIGDRLVYLGNAIGLGGDAALTVDALLYFRRAFLTLPGMEPDDIVHLRGAQEEIWRKMLELQFSTEPSQTLAWMLDNGAGATLRAYGGDPARATANCRAGALAITRWTGELRRALHAHPGHDEFYASLRRVAMTEQDGGILFVHAGVDADRPIDDQKDAFWWGGPVALDRLENPFAGFLGVVAGWDPDGGTAKFGSFGGYIDEGCGRGGTLAAYCFTPDGAIVDRIAV